jgi:hypothetical protein
MIERVKEIYLKLYRESYSCTKNKLKDYFKVTEKTIENTLKPYSKVIIYDKQLKRYRFTKLLPDFIPYEVFYEIFSESIANSTIKKDFLKIKNLFMQENEGIVMISTSDLSDFAKKIIMFTIAINDNNILKIEYTKNGDQKEIKFIKPHTIICNGFTYYCYASYEKRNEENVDSIRTFEFNRIGNIESLEFLSDEIFKIEQNGNAFGPYEKNKYIVLEFDRMSTDFFRKSNIFQNSTYEIMDINENTLIAKMYYNSLEIEVVKLIQQWMPHIKISDDDENKSKVYKIIKDNFEKLIF